MRSKEVLFDLKDISILYQYLYISEDNFVTIDNGITKLEIRMNEDGYFHAKNLSFPDSPDLNYTDVMNVSNCLGIIDQLKEVKAVEFPEKFKNRWEEITTVTVMQLSLNRY